MNGEQDDTREIVAKIVDVSVDIAGRSILQDVTLAIEFNDAIVVTGPTGTGKTTMAAVIGGLRVPTAGTVWRRYGDRPSPGQVGWILQTNSALPRRRVIDNAILAILGCGTTRVAALSIARTYLAAVGLHERAHDLAGQLSGGELQRLAIARAIAASPAFLIADEPTANLDRRTADQMLELLIEPRRKGALLLITHDDTIANTFKQRYRLGEKQVSLNCAESKPAPASTGGSRRSRAQRSGAMWRLRSIVGEAARNAAAARSRGALLIILLAAFLTISGVATALRASQVIAVAQKQVLAGTYARVLSSASGTVPAERCAKLEQNPAVLAAGVVSAASETALPNGSTYSHYEVSASAMRVVDPAAVDVSLAVGQQTAKELALAEGGTLPGSAPGAVAVHILAASRFPSFDRAILSSGAVRRAERCVVEFVAGAEDAGDSVLALELGRWTADLGVNYNIASVADPIPAYLAPESLWSSRTERHLWVVVASLMSSVFLMHMRSRRHELALYRILGMRRADATLMTIVEYALFALPGVAVALSTALTGAAGRARLREAALAGLLSLCLVGVASLCFRSRDPLTDLKER